MEGRRILVWWRRPTAVKIGAETFGGSDEGQEEGPLGWTESTEANRVLEGSIGTGQDTGEGKLIFGETGEGAV